MRHKTRYAAFAALAAITSITIAHAEGSGANAQSGENPEISEPALTEEVVPVFVENEVVQPLPEQTDSPVSDAASLADLVARTLAAMGLSAPEVHSEPEIVAAIRGGAMPHIPRSSAAWKRAKAIARIAHEGLWQSEARDALYFHANYVNPSWRHSKQARATIDTHIFYR